MEIRSSRKRHEFSLNNDLYQDVDSVSYSDFILLVIIHYKKNFKKPYVMNCNIDDIKYIMKYCKDNNIELNKI